jgi:hypothetical protein
MSETPAGARPPQGVVGRPRLSPPVARSRRVIAAAHFAGGHGLPLTALAVLDLVLLRNLLFTSRLPAGVDSSFLYSLLPFFTGHGLLTFEVWLPAPLGQIQQYSAYWLLASANAVVPDPVAVYKGAVALTLLVAAWSAYGLAYWLTRSRLAAVVGAALYVCSPFSVSIWLTGHLDVGMSYALGPLALWALWAALRSGSRGATIGLGLSVSALYLLTTGQGVYWVLPLATVLLVEFGRAARARRGRTFVRRVLHVAALGAVVFAAASAVGLLPLITHASAPYANRHTTFYIEGVGIHRKYSQPFLDNVLGVPLETWTEPGVRISISDFGVAPYRFVSFLLLVIAASALARPRLDPIALFVPTALAWLLAAGPDGPIGSIYLFLYHHVPYFSLLRAPSRWGMVSTLGTMMLVAMAIGGLPNTLGSRLLPLLVSARTAAAAVAVALGTLLATYALFSGLPTWRPPASYARAFGPLRHDREDWRVLTTPFYQQWMGAGAPYGTKTAIMADLGATSTFWHHHAVIGRGGWDVRAARFTRYLYELTRGGATRSMAKLLGAVGVKYVALEPQPATEVLDGQNRFFARQFGLRAISHTGGITIYRNPYALPQAYLTRQTCIVAGGMHVLGDVATDPTFDFGRTALIFADQLAAVSGPRGLVRALSSARCVIATRGGPRALAILSSTRPVDLAPLAPPSWERLETNPSRDIGAEPSTTVAVPPHGVVRGKLVAPTGGRYVVCVAGLQSGGISSAQVNVDGDPLGAVNWSPVVGRRIQWARTAPALLSAGAHTFALRNGQGRILSVTKVALIRDSALARAPGLSRASLIRERGGSIANIAGLRRNGPRIASHWHDASGSPGAVALAATVRRTRLRVIRPGRRYFTFARARLNRQIDPERVLALRLTGARTGQTFFLNVLFDAHGAQTASFAFRDGTSLPRTVYLSPLDASGLTVVPDWSRARWVTLSTTSKRPWSREMTIDGLYSLAQPRLRPRFVAAGKRESPFRDAPRGVSALSPPDQVIGDRAHLAANAGTGTLVFTQSYEPRWHLSADGATRGHVIALGFANAYSVRRLRGGELSFGPARAGRIGWWISLIAWLACGGISVALARRAARRASAPHATRNARPEAARPPPDSRPAVPKPAVRGSPRSPSQTRDARMRPFARPMQIGISDIGRLMRTASLVHWWRGRRH